MDSNARIDVTGCAVYVNSNHASALTLRSNSNMRADDIYVAGGYDLFSNAWTNPSPPETGEIPIADPLGNLPTPTQDHHLHPITSTPASGLAQGCDFTNRTLNSNQSATLNPGIYCGGIWLASNSGVILNPGFYVMKPSLTRPGALHMDSNTTLQGAGVLFYLTGAGSIVDLNSNSSVDISAPTSATALTYPVLAPYVGVVIFQDRALSGLVNRLNSNKRYFGAVYMPNNDILVDSNGSISANSLCTIFIARRYHFDSNATFTGNYNISQNCPALIANAVTGGGGGTVSTKLLR
jgi:type 1 fimbria pilin